MGKGIGLVGGFNGKFGNAVGYSLKDSNNKQTQGIRAYQPVVRNPKTYRQASQRCIMKPINNFYRKVKHIIDRGFENKSYGNASRLAWLKLAMTDYKGPWLTKEEAELRSWTLPILCPLTYGSLPAVPIEIAQTVGIYIGSANADLVEIEDDADLIANLQKAGIDVQYGDQITVVGGSFDDEPNLVFNGSTIFGGDDAGLFSLFTVTGEGAAKRLTVALSGTGFEKITWGAVIISRKGANGKHLRSTTIPTCSPSHLNNGHYDYRWKDAAVKSYMSSDANTDWPQDSLYDNDPYDEG